MSGLFCKFSSNSPFYYFMVSDSFGKFIVILLFLISMLSWFLMIDKFLKIKAAIKKAEETEKSFSESDSCLVFAGRLDEEDNPLARIYATGMKQLKQISSCDDNDLVLCGQEKLLPKQLSGIETESIRKALEKKVNEEIIDIENNMGVMSTIVSTTPFFGLLGTVYGVMLSFGGMAEQGSAELTAIAPGIAGALLTTVAGLLVAIPSVIGFNMLADKIRLLTSKLDSFSDNLVSNLILHRAKRPRGE